MDIEKLKRRLQQRQEIDCGSHHGIAIKYPPLGTALYEMAAVAEAIKVIESLQRELEEARKALARVRRVGGQMINMAIDAGIDAAHNQKI